jgi:hypothetical protein
VTAVLNRENGFSDMWVLCCVSISHYRWASLRVRWKGPELSLAEDELSRPFGEYPARLRPFLQTRVGSRASLKLPSALACLATGGEINVVKGLTDLSSDPVPTKASVQDVHVGRRRVTSPRLSGLGRFVSFRRITGIQCWRTV